MIFVGLKHGNPSEVFRSRNTPTESSHGQQYFAAIGPFRTVRGATFMALFGNNNPHCQTVYQAEELGKQYGVSKEQKEKAKAKT